MIIIFKISSIGSGGALFLLAASTNFSSINVTASSAGSVGGAFYVSSGDYSFVSVEILYSSSLLDGGAIFAGNCLGLCENANITSVAACSVPPAANYYIQPSCSASVIPPSMSSLIFNGVTILNSSASVSGGGVYIDENVTGNLQFTSITHGSSTYGGGIFDSSNLPVYMANFSVSSSSASLLGGGFYVEGNVTCIGCLFTNNTAYNGSGIFVENGTHIFNYTNILFNLADGYGGGLYITNGNVSLSKSKLISNCATLGGSVFYKLSGFFSEFAVTVSGAGCTTGNSSYTQTGGTTVLQGSCNPVLNPVLCNDCMVSNSFSNTNGGVFSILGGILFVENCQFLSNSALGNGGVLYGASSQVNFVTSLFIGNSAVGQGGGMSVSNMLSYSVVGSKFQSHNSLSNGGVFAMGGTLGVTGNCTISGTSFISSVSKANGGVIYAANALSGSCTLSSLTIQSSTASLSGGAIFAQSGNFLMDHIYSTATTAVAGNGGFMHQDLGTLSGSVFFINSTSSLTDGGLFWLNNVRGNFTSMNLLSATAGGAGGVFYLSSLSAFNMNNSNIGSSTAGTHGGCVSSNTPYFVLINSNFSNCTSKNGAGGALYLNVSNVTSAGPIILSSLYLKNNLANGDGAGLYTENAVSIISNVSFSNNTAQGNGGGFYSAYGAPTFAQCYFLQNTAVLNGGGGYWTKCPAVFSAGTPFTSNIAVGSGGGFYQQSGSVALNNFFIQNNQALNGGGFYIEAGTLDINTIALSNNVATGQGGSYFILGGNSTSYNVTCQNSLAANGGCGCVMGGQHTMSSVNVFKNNASNAGGGFYFGGGVTTFANVSLTNLYATHGGAAYFIQSVVSFNNAYVSWSGASSEGGGFSFYNTLATISNVLFTNLTASVGGGVSVSNQSSVAISNTVFDYNTAGNGGAISILNALNLTVTDTQIYDNFGTQTGSGAALYFNGGSTYLSNVLVYRNGCPSTTCSMFAGVSGTLSGSNVSMWNEVAPFGGFGSFLSSVVSFSQSTFSCDPNVTRVGSLQGGAVFSSGSTLQFVNSNITNCTASEGGAFYLSTGSSYFENITLSGHFTSSGNGGAMSIHDGSHTLYHTLLTQNKAFGAGGAIYYTGPSATPDGNGGYLFLYETNIVENYGKDLNGQDVYVDVNGFLKFNSSWLTSTTPPITNWTSCNVSLVNATNNVTYNKTVYGRSVSKTIWDTCPTFIADNPLNPLFDHLHRVVQICAAPLYAVEANNEGYNGWRQESSSLYMNHGYIYTSATTLLGTIDRAVLNGQIRGEWIGDFNIRDLILSSQVTVYPGALSNPSQPYYINGPSLSTSNPGSVISNPPNIIPTIGDYSSYSHSGGISYISQNLTIGPGGSFVVTGDLILQVGATAVISSLGQVGASKRFEIDMEAYVSGDRYLFGFPVQLSGNISAGLRAPSTCNVSACPIPVNANGTQIDLYNKATNSYLYGGVMQVIGDFQITSSGVVQVDLWLNSSTNPVCSGAGCRRRRWTPSTQYDAVGHDVITATGTFTFEGRLEVIRYGGFRYDPSDPLTTDKLPPIGATFTPFWYGNRGLNVSQPSQFCTNASIPAIDPFYTNKFMKFFASAPKIANICLRNDLVTLQLTFDRPTDQDGVISNFFPCGLVFRNDTVHRIDGDVAPIPKCITGRSDGITETEASGTFYQSPGTCSFTTASLLTVIKGSGSNLNVGEIMYINPNTTLRGLDTNNNPFTLHEPGFNYFTDGFLIITPCSQLPEPVAVIQAPSRIGLCDVLELDGSLSLGAGGAQLTYSWGSSYLDIGTGGNQMMRGINGKLSFAKNNTGGFIFNFINDPGMSECPLLTIPFSAESGNPVNYFGNISVSLIVANQLGQRSEYVYLRILRENYARPPLKPSSNLNAVVKFTDLTYVMVANKFLPNMTLPAGCDASESVFYNWELLGRYYYPPGASISLVYDSNYNSSKFWTATALKSKKTSQLALAPRTIEYPYYYKVRAYAWFENAPPGDNNYISTVDFTISTYPAAIQARICGVSKEGSVTYSQQSSKTVTLSGCPYDLQEQILPNQYSYSWSCLYSGTASSNSLPVPCHASAFQPSPTGNVTIIPNQFEVGSYDICMTASASCLTVDLNTTTCSATTCIKMKIVGNPGKRALDGLCEVSVETSCPLSTTIKTSPSDPVVLYADAGSTCSSCDELHYSWSVLAGNFALNNQTMLTDPDYPYLVIRPNVLPLIQEVIIGVEVTATCKGVPYSGSSYVNLGIVSLPPSAGTFTISPQKGNAFLTPFTIQAWDWGALPSDQPFSMRFALMLDVGELSLTDWVPSGVLSGVNIPMSPTFQIVSSDFIGGTLADYFVPDIPPYEVVDIVCYIANLWNAQRKMIIHVNLTRPQLSDFNVTSFCSTPQQHNLTDLEIYCLASNDIVNSSILSTSQSLDTTKVIAQISSLGSFLNQCPSLYVESIVKKQQISECGSSTSAVGGTGGSKTPGSTFDPNCCLSIDAWKAQRDELRCHFVDQLILIVETKSTSGVFYDQLIRAASILSMIPSEMCADQMVTLVNILADRLVELSNSTEVLLDTTADAILRASYELQQNIIIAVESTDSPFNITEEIWMATDLNDMIKSMSLALLRGGGCFTVCGQYDNLNDNFQLQVRSKKNLFDALMCGNQTTPPINIGNETDPEYVSYVDTYMPCNLTYPSVYMQCGNETFDFNASNSCIQNSLQNNLLSPFRNLVPNNAHMATGQATLNLYDEATGCEIKFNLSDGDEKFVFCFDNRQAEGNYYGQGKGIAGGKCAFWNEERFIWDSTGVTMIYADENITCCQSKHLTSFGVLLLGGNGLYWDWVRIASVTLLCLCFLIVIGVVVFEVASKGGCQQYNLDYLERSG